MAKNFLTGLFGRKGKQDDAADGAAESAAPDKENTTSAEPPATTAPAIEAPEAPAEVKPAEPETPIANTAEHQTSAPEENKKQNWFSRLASGLSKSSTRIGDGVAGIFTKRKLDSETIEELEELLIAADLGLAAAERITDTLAQDKFDKEISDEEVRGALAGEVAETLAPLEKPLVANAENSPHVILMIGVNGAGKTTTIGKLARKFIDDGKSVMFAAGDTFRAAAIEQLTAWGARTGAPVVARDVGADAAGLAFDAVKEAQEKNTDVLLIDTAGRLQNKSALMDELAKIVRVLKKLDDTAPHDVVLVLDATVGQNAIAQAQAFSDIAGVTGLIMTKLDGTARGGVLVALADKFKLPIHYIGVGESVEDLQPFNASAFARALAGLTAD